MTNTPLPQGTAAMSVRTHYVYEAWCDDICTYVGMTGDLPRRLREHQLRQPWWSVVTRFAVSTYPDRVSASRAEERRIAQLRPANNRLVFDGLVDA